MTWSLLSCWSLLLANHDWWGYSLAWVEEGKAMESPSDYMTGQKRVTSSRDSADTYQELSSIDSMAMRRWVSRALFSSRHKTQNAHYAWVLRMWSSHSGPHRPLRRPLGPQQNPASARMLIRCATLMIGEYHQFVSASLTGPGSTSSATWSFSQLSIDQKGIWWTPRDGSIPFSMTRPSTVSHEDKRAD